MAGNCKAQVCRNLIIFNSLLCNHISVPMTRTAPGIMEGVPTTWGLGGGFRMPSFLPPETLLQ